MSFSYDEGLSDTTSQVRFLIQDTNDARVMFQDTEIAWVLAQEANIYMAAAALCDTRVIKLGGTGGVKRKKVGDLDITYDIEFFERRSAMLRARGSGHQIPYAGGISLSDKDRLKQDPDWAPPAMPRGALENPTAPKMTQPSSANPLTTI